MENVLPFARREQLADQASGCPALTHVAGILEHIGPGLKLTVNGNLCLAAVRALAERFGCLELVDPVVGGRRFRTVSSIEIVPVDLIFRWSRAAGFVRIVHGSVVPTARGKRLGADPLDDWRRLFDAFVRKLRWPETSLGGFHAERYFWLRDVASAIGRSLAVLEMSPEPIWITNLAAMIELDLVERYDLSSLAEERFTALPEEISRGGLGGWTDGRP